MKQVLKVNTQNPPYKRMRHLVKRSIIPQGPSFKDVHIEEGGGLQICLIMQSKKVDPLNLGVESHALHWLQLISSAKEILEVYLALPNAVPLRVLAVPNRPNESIRHWCSATHGSAK